MREKSGDGEKEEPAAGLPLHHHRARRVLPVSGGRKDDCAASESGHRILRSAAASAGAPADSLLSVLIESPLTT